MTSLEFAKNHFRMLGIRLTRQRIELYIMLADAGPLHLRVQDALARLRQKGRPVSLATLYNNFRLFATVGIIRPVTCDVDGRIFDTNTSPHHHIINSATGEIMDTDQIDYLLKDNFAIEPGHKIASVEITIKLEPIVATNIGSKLHKQRSDARR